jgi:polygalacturonase
VARIRVEGVEMDGVATPVAVNAFYFCDPDGRSEAVQARRPAPIGPGTPRISDIALTDVVARGAAFAGVAALGLPEAPVRGLRLDRVAVSFHAGAGMGVPLMAEGVPAMRHVPLFAEHVEIDGQVEIMATREETVPC